MGAASAAAVGDVVLAQLDDGDFGGAGGFGDSVEVGGHECAAVGLLVAGCDRHGGLIVGSCCFSLGAVPVGVELLVGGRLCVV